MGEALRIDMELPEAMEATGYSPYCPFCGQVFLAEECTSDYEARAEGLERCECDEARAERQKHDVMARAEALMSEGCEAYGMKGTVEEEARHLVMEAIQVVFGDYAAAVTVVIRGGDVVKVKKDATGDVRIERMQKVVGRM